MTTRRKNDIYTTEESLTAVLDYFCFPVSKRRKINGVVMEPCAGPGLMANQLRSWAEVTAVFTNDVDPQYGTADVSDAGDPNADVWRSADMFSVDWVVTNPPFSDAWRILPLALEHAKIGVAFLLRLTYAEPVQKKQPRAKWLQQYADCQVWQSVVNPRPMFRKGEVNPKTGKTYRTDSATVAWFVWQKGWSWERRGILPPFSYVTNWNGGQRRG